ncbi:hypothetical protein [Rhizobium hidalgonense]|uniref:hypothetical protein n=1 Tax=Rhizobium hidalgonense TaxID=1538159 RepID=UPI002872A90E|nr:hypothetical protein [Rhizobium hidalgonense]MDR9804677.1 hypothetical protein [Rhizobium hidalgonense]
MNDDIQRSEAAVGFDSLTKTGSFLLIRTGRAPCAVSVTRRAILNVASPPRATTAHFWACIETFRAIATEKGHGGETRLTITAEDVRRWRRQNGSLSPETDPKAQGQSRSRSPITFLEDYRRGRLRLNNQHLSLRAALRGGQWSEDHGEL